MEGRVIALEDDRVQLGGWNADGHLRGVQVEPEPDHVGSGVHTLLGGESHAQHRAQADERVERPARDEVGGLATDKVVHVDEGVVPAPGHNPGDRGHHMNTGGAGGAAAKWQSHVVADAVQSYAVQRRRQRVRSH